jgi:hypothetical protein
MFRFLKLSQSSILRPRSLAMNVSRRPFSPDNDASPMLTFVDNDNEHLIFGPIDVDSQDVLYNRFQWDSFDSPASNNSLFSAPSPALIDSNIPVPFPSTPHDSSTNDFYLSNWLHDPDPPHLASSPIPIPAHQQQPAPFVPFPDSALFPLQDASAFSPADFAALHPLPRSSSPNRPFDGFKPLHGPFDSISPLETSMPTPAWASQLWPSPPSYVHTTASPPLQHSPLSDAAYPRRRLSLRRDSLIFQSSSAPSAVHNARPAALVRAYTRRAESSSVIDDRDATIRRKKRSPTHDEHRSSTTTDRTSESRSYPLSPFVFFHCDSHLSSIGPASSFKVPAKTPEASPLRLAALLYRLDPAAAGLQHSEIERRSGSQRGRAGIRRP